MIRGIAMAVALLGLSGCATAREWAPDPALMAPCHKSMIRGNTVEDLADVALARGRDLDECSGRMEALRVWTEGKP